MNDTTDRNTIELEVLLGQAGYGARDPQGRWLSDGCASPIEARYVGEQNALKLATFTPGARVRTTRDLDRYPHFIVEAGALGTVVDVGDPDVFAVRLDDHVDGAEEWANEVHWSNGDLPHDDLELVDEDRIHPRAPDGFEVDAARRIADAIGAEERRRGVTLEGVPAAIGDRVVVPDTDSPNGVAYVERDEQDAAYERVSYPKVELDPADARFVVENLEYLAGVDEGEHTDRERLLELAGRLDTAQAIARAGALGVELAFSLSGEPVFDVGFVNLMLDELEALPVDERAAAVAAANDGSSVSDRRAYEEGLRA